MKKLYWLLNTQPCTIEVTGLKDCNNQPLKFTKPGTSYARRCVTEETRKHELVEMYIRQHVLKDEADAPDQPIAAPTLVEAAPPPAEPEESVPASEPEPVPEVPEATPEPDDDSEPEPVSQSVETESEDDAENEEDKPAAKSRRRRRKS